MSQERCFYATNVTPPVVEGHVYVLKCECSKFYVGFSREVETRIASHFLGNGSLWTKKYKPLEVVSVKPGDMLLENVITISLMAMHGYQNVCGGKYCKVDMPAPPSSLSKALKYQPQPDPA